MIRFEGKSYPAKWIDVDGFGERYISVESLEKALIDEDTFVSKDAQWLDERIFFYVPDEDWGRGDLGKYVASLII